MAMSHGIDPDVIPANALGRALGIFVLVISLVGLLLALWLGGLVVALLDLLTSLGLAARGASASPYPLGAWTLAIYLGGGPSVMYAAEALGAYEELTSTDAAQATAA